MPRKLLPEVRSFLGFCAIKALRILLIIFSENIITFSEKMKIKSKKPLYDVIIWYFSEFLGVDRACAREETKG